MTTIWSVIREHMLANNEADTKSLYRAVRRVYKRYDRMTLNKRIYALKKEGLIIRTGYGTYTLTDTGRMDNDADLRGGAKAKANAQASNGKWRKADRISAPVNVLTISMPDGSEPVVRPDQIISIIRELAEHRDAEVAHANLVYQSQVEKCINYLNTRQPTVDRKQILQEIFAKIAGE